MAGWFARLLGRSAGEPHEPVWLDVADLRARLAEAEHPVVLDVRGPDEFDGPLGHIEGARNIPLPQLAAHMAELARTESPIVCVCLTDKRSSQAAADLMAAGLRDVAVLRGGMRAWRAA